MLVGNGPAHAIDDVKSKVVVVISGPQMTEKARDGLGLTNQARTADNHRPAAAASGRNHAPVGHLAHSPECRDNADTEALGDLLHRGDLVSNREPAASDGALERRRNRHILRLARLGFDLSLRPVLEGTELKSKCS